MVAAAVATNINERDNMKNIREKLSLAVCTTLGCMQHTYAIDNAWKLDSSYLYYNEDNDRVAVNKIILHINGDLTEDDNASATLVLDGMSGATPSGAVRSENSSVTTTSASGAGGSSLNGASPDLVAFTDTRLAFTLDWAHQRTRLQKINFGGSVSTENDYQSYGASTSINIDNKNRSNTYTLGIGVSYDAMFRKTGGTPVPLSRVENESFYGDGEKYVYEAIAGFSHVINRRTIAQINYNAIYSDGYHTDPYKVISTASIAGVSSDTTFSYAEIDRYYESRPFTRMRNALFTSLAHQYGGASEVIHISYRYYSDDWEIAAHTLDLTHRSPAGENAYIEPHVRYHTQSAASFFKHHLEQNEPLPEFVSADSRLDAMQDFTVGMQYGQDTGSSHWRLRLERINQQFESAEHDENLAWVMQFSYAKQF